MGNLHPLGSLLQMSRARDLPSLADRVDCTDQGPPCLGKPLLYQGRGQSLERQSRHPPKVSLPPIPRASHNGSRAENSFYFAAASGTFSLSLRSALHLSINLLVHHRSHVVYGYLLRDTPEILRLLAQVALHWRMQPKAREEARQALSLLHQPANVAKWVFTRSSLRELISSSWNVAFGEGLSLTVPFYPRCSQLPTWSARGSRPQTPGSAPRRDTVPEAFVIRD